MVGERDSNGDTMGHGNIIMGIPWAMGVLSWEYYHRSTIMGVLSWEYHGPWVLIYKLLRLSILSTHENNFI